MKAVFLLGPTASGKTAVALALAERFAAEIVSVDSAQVYRGMDIGTAKPDPATLARVPHHLVDILDPTESYSAGRFRADAERAIAAIERRGRLPIVAGGTMLYFRALMGGLAELPPAQPQVRAHIEARAAEQGWPRLHAELARLDPGSAARIEPTDAQRIQRALEVHYHTGRPLSEHHREATAAPADIEALALSLEPSERAVLHQRIAQRFRAMLEAGLVEELEALRARFALQAGLPSMRTVGYRQAWETLEGLAPAVTLEARGIAATRQLAKRQLTWLRAMGEKPGTHPVERFDALRPDLVRAVTERVERFVERRR
ncbi:MAG TPA: tRNA (adenosine(37)-N6)-dimethylallyltransferase MiaA [Usitatibacter sp.]|nr:tRNA (adenosine(37)-N6)-dimethylallyltransferase MiaA [Usitatibacter sp.]